MVKYCILFSVTLTIGLCGFLASILLYTLTGGDVPLDYGLVLDAGSTHTQFTLYKWHGEKDRNTGWVEQLDSCSINDPLSKADPEYAGSLLLPCLDNVTRHLPSDKKATTQVFLGATAGFRILNNSEPYLSEAILISVQCILKSYGLMFKKADIITGRDEGLYAWITTNFLTRSLQSQKSEMTMGAMDLGGASTQIAYSLNQSIVNGNFQQLNSDNGTALVKLYGTSHIVQSTSYLCFGSKQILNRHFAVLVQNLSSISTILDPCSAKGFQKNISADELFGQACTRNDLYDEFLFKNRHVKETISYTFNGTSNSEECRALVNNLLKPDTCRKHNFTDCFSPPTYVPTETQFVAISSFYYLTKFLNATNVTLDKFRQLTTSFCEKTWDEAREVGNRNTVDEEILSQMCFEAHYVDLILTDAGYGFNNATWSNLQFIKKMNHTDLGWSMGYMINATNSILPEEANPPEINLTIMVILLLISIGLLVAAVIFFRKQRMLRSPSSSYLHV